MPCCISERQLALPSCAMSAVSDREHDLRIAFDVGSSVPRRSTCGKTAAHRRSASSWLQRWPLRTNTLRTPTVRQRFALSRQPSRDHQHPRQSVCRRFSQCSASMCLVPIYFVHMCNMPFSSDARMRQIATASNQTAKSDGLFGVDSRRCSAIARLAHCSFTHAETWTTHRLVEHTRLAWISLDSTDWADVMCLQETRVCDEQLEALRCTF